MKIAYVYDAVYPYRIGGVEKRIYELSRRLALMDHEVHIFGLKAWEGEGSFIKDGVYYHGLGESRPFYIRGRRSTGEACFFGWKVLTPLLKEHFDIIDCQNFPYFSCFSAAFAAKMRRSPLVITWHEVWNDYWYEYLGSNGSFGKIVERCTARLSGNLVAVSELTRRDLARLNPRTLIKVIPNGIDVQQINAVQPNENYSDIIFTGRLIHEKRPDLLIEALVLIKKEIPDIQCVVVGGGPEKEELHKICRKYHLEKNLLFKGFVRNHNEVISLMKESKVFASPSLREGFGIAALEALACGLPVVTSNAPKNAVKELINEQTGIICDSEPEAFAESILVSLERKNSMKQDCIRKAESYDWDLILKNLGMYYSDNVRAN